MSRCALAAECNGTSLDDLKEREYVAGPFSLVELKLDTRVTIGPSSVEVPPEVVESFEARFAESDEIYYSQFATDPESDDYWGYEQLVLVRNSCVVFTAMLSHDN